MEINFLTFWKLEVQNGGVSSAVGPLKALGDFVPWLFQLRVAQGLLWSSITLVSACLYMVVRMTL